MLKRTSVYTLNIPFKEYTNKSLIYGRPEKKKEKS